MYVFVSVQSSTWAPFLCIAQMHLLPVLPAAWWQPQRFTQQTGKYRHVFLHLVLLRPLTWAACQVALHAKDDGRTDCAAYCVISTQSGTPLAKHGSNHGGVGCVWTAQLVPEFLLQRSAHNLYALCTMAAPAHAGALRRKWQIGTLDLTMVKGQ